MDPIGDAIDDLWPRWDFDRLMVDDRPARAAAKTIASAIVDALRQSILTDPLVVPALKPGMDRKARRAAWAKAGRALTVRLTP